MWRFFGRIGTLHSSACVLRFFSLSLDLTARVTLRSLFYICISAFPKPNGFSRILIKLWRLSGELRFLSEKEQLFSTGIYFVNWKHVPFWIPLKKEFDSFHSLGSMSKRTGLVFHIVCSTFHVERPRFNNRHISESIPFSCVHFDPVEHCIPPDASNSPWSNRVVKGHSRGENIISPSLAVLPFSRLRQD